MTLNLSFLHSLLRSISVRSRANPRTSLEPSAAPIDELARACEALMQPGGEASEIRIAHRALTQYARLDGAGRQRFFRLLLEQYGTSPQAIHDAYGAYAATEDASAAQRLFEVCEPHRQELLRRLNRHPGGTYELVKMRAHLLDALREHPELKPLDADFTHLFASWFNRGFLVLESIDWNTPAAILEKVIRYEAVHEIHGWDELRNRLNPDDRRCYAFFHPATGDEPLIFVEVALSRGTPGNIQTILFRDETLSATEADTAVFYSISNCQDGLKGISFGNFLIKQVVQELQRELPGLNQFMTLSPVPGFGGWLETEAARGRQLLSEAHREQIISDVPLGAEVKADLAVRLSELAAHYLTRATRGDGRPLDAVARFHLGNGASLHGIHAFGDTSARGLALSYGVMVNYLYEPDRIEQNHEAYSRHGRVVCPGEIERLAARVPRPDTEQSTSVPQPTTQTGLST
jgi:malonyl-CoA decarboxylase